MAHVAVDDREEIERCLAGGDLSRALRLSESLLAANPADVQAQAVHATVLMASGDWAGAAARLQEVVQSPEAPYAAKPRLAACLMRLGDHAGALAPWRMALAERPDDFVQRLGYAECLVQTGDPDTALPQFFRAVCDAQKAGRWLSDASTPSHLRDRVHAAMATIDEGRRALFEGVLDRHIATFGADAMQRVRHALAVHLGIELAAGGDPRQKSLFFHMPGLPSTPYFDRALFPWYAALESAAPAIREELLAVLDARAPLVPFLGETDAETTEPYLGGNPSNRAWDAYFLHRHGRRFDEHLARCPLTAQALGHVPLTVVRDHAPEVLFSLLAPGTHIKPHHGVTNTRVVTHLPLVIPEGDCKLVVGGVAHAWQQGRCITFDDTFQHEAWNRTGERRAVMILDTWNPYLTEPECIALKDLIEQIGDFNLNSTSA